MGGRGSGGAGDRGAGHSGPNAPDCGRRAANLGLAFYGKIGGAHGDGHALADGRSNWTGAAVGNGLWPI